MGKSKKRILAKGRYDQITNLTREEATDIAVQKLMNNEDARNIITLFGLTAEELLEAGAAYEMVKALGSLV